MPADPIKTVLAKAEEARAKLTKREEELQRDINEIDDIEWDRPLNAAELKRRKEKRAEQTSVRAAKTETTFITLRALNETPEVQRLINAFQSINRDLKKEHERLKKIGEAAETTAKIIDALADLATDLAKLLAS